MFRVPIVGWILRQWDAIPVEREGRDSASVRRMLGVLRAGGVLAVAAEGTRTRSGQLEAINPVLARIAAGANVPILPVGIGGSFAAMPPGAHWPRPVKITVRIGPVFRLERGTDADQAARRIRAEIARQSCRPRCSRWTEPVSSLSRSPWWTVSRKRLGLLALPLLICPLFAGPVALNLANQVALASIGALALTVLMGAAGDIRLGHAALLAAGGFTVGVLTQELNAPAWITLPAAVAIGASLGFIVGLPSLRLRGIYLALSTLALHFAVLYLASEYQTHRRLSTGIVPPDPCLDLWCSTTQRRGMSC